MVVLRTRNTLKEVIDEMILSASGWRGIFTADEDGESHSRKISVQQTIINMSIAKVYIDWVKSKIHLDEYRPYTIVVGHDSRPTSGPISCDIMGMLINEGCRVIFTDCAAIPEFLSFLTCYADVDGFIYISASHNPVGHNGFKFGLGNIGRVLNNYESQELISAFHAYMSDENAVLEYIQKIKPTYSDMLVKIVKSSIYFKGKMLQSYASFCEEVIAGNGADKHKIFKIISNYNKKRKIGIVADFNGSARANSIDKVIFKSYGMNFECINANIETDIVHRIVPEGESLIPCCKFLEAMHRVEPSYIIGYMPDCDGDRGNLVIWDDRQNRVRPLEAQEVFALCCLSELAYLEWTGAAREEGANIAVAANDPTSLRIEAIARCFNAYVFRAEVGEANVLQLAYFLRQLKYTVRFLGEGSAGGNITYPSSVRDPVSTVFSVVKLLTIRKGMNGKGPGLFEIWCEKSGQMSKFKKNFTLADIIDTMPKWTTTGVYDERALVRVKTKDQVLLKREYQKVFKESWKNFKGKGQEYEVYFYNGVVREEAGDDWGLNGSGGLKIIFVDSDKLPVAALWMRCSATENVFRIMADVYGDGESSIKLEEGLLNVQRQMLITADITAQEKLKQNLREGGAETDVQAEADVQTGADTRSEADSDLNSDSESELNSDRGD